MLTSKTVALLSLMAFLLPILGLAITAEDERMIYKNPSVKRFYDWDSVQPTPATPRKRFYSWNYSQGAVPPQPEITPKERQFLKEFLQQKGADWLANHKMYAQYKDSLLIRRR